VLLTTGYFDGEDKLEDLNLLYKPYRATDLAEKIQSLMRSPQEIEFENAMIHQAAAVA
jgi:hypothetical protein